VTGGGFVPNALQIQAGDSVLWSSEIGSSVQVKDLASGFTDVYLDAYLKSNVTYSSVASYSFYVLPGGQTGTLSIVNRSGVVYVHDSSKDLTIGFVVRSRLPQSTLVLNAVSPAFVIGHNTSQQGILSLQNTQNAVIYNITLSGQWMNFSDADSGFYMNPLSLRYVYFNITPVVSRTSETNKSYDVVVTARSLNAGNVR